MVIIFRTIILYIIVVLSLRLMGKRQISQLQPAELAVAIMISDLASIPMQTKDIPLFSGIIPVLVLTCIEIFLSMFILKSVRFRKIVTGKPSILIINGVLQEATLKDLRFTVNDLHEEMRINKVNNINDIMYAILETNGQVSFILNKNANPPTVKDLGLDIKNEFLPFPILTKGIFNRETLKIINRDEAWVVDKLKSKKIDDLDKVLLACANHSDIIFVQTREEKTF